MGVSNWVCRPATSFDQRRPRTRLRGLLDRLQKALEARFKGRQVAIGPDAIPQPAYVIVHDRDLSHASAKKAIREELDRIEPSWSAWLAVDR